MVPVIPPQFCDVSSLPKKQKENAINLKEKDKMFPLRGRHFSKPCLGQDSTALTPRNGQAQLLLPWPCSGHSV